MAVFTIPLSAWISLTSPGVWSFTTLIYVFGLVPLLELFFKPDHKNLTTAEAEVLKNDPLYDWLLYLIPPLQWAFLGYFLIIVQSPGSLVTTIGQVIAFGIMCGVFGINVAHELGHRKEKHAQLMAKVLLLSSLYMHFFIEHNRGHHKKVSTPDDPASAHLGENIYFFWLRSLLGSYLSAWRLEGERLRKNGFKMFHWRNEMIWYQLAQLSLLAAIFFWAGLTAMLLFISSAVVGILLLETVNYIEHYGLARTSTAEGHYEKVKPHHSWNSDHIIGRLMLFELSRHSDHHYKASKKYQILEHHEHSPQMPTGYPGMMLVALVPPAWFGLMHPLIKS